MHLRGSGECGWYDMKMGSTLPPFYKIVGQLKVPWKPSSRWMPNFAMTEKFLPVLT